MASSLTIKGGDKLYPALKRIADNLGKAQQLRVGFLEGATYPDGTSVAMVAATQEFGAPAAGIPSRSYFRTMIADKSPGWGVKLGKIAVAADYDSEITLGRMGELIRSQLQRSIINTNSPELSQVTVDRKGFAKPLIDTAQMINSAEYEVDGTRGTPAPQIKSPGSVKKP